MKSLENNVVQMPLDRVTPFGNLRRFRVTIPLAGYDTYEVEARSEAEARRDFAKRGVLVDHGMGGTDYDDSTVAVEEVEG